MVYESYTEPKKGLGETGQVKNPKTIRIKKKTIVNYFFYSSFAFLKAIL